MRQTQTYIDGASAEYTDGEAQDAVGTIISGTGAVTVNYNNATPQITISGSESSGGATEYVSGSYTGDGSTSNAITGLGGQPKFLEICSAGNWASSAGLEKYSWFDEMTSNETMREKNTTSDFQKNANRIMSIDSDGFTVSDGGGNSDPNTNGQVYKYWALI